MKKTLHHHIPIIFGGAANGEIIVTFIPGAAALCSHCAESETLFMSAFQEINSALKNSL